MYDEETRILADLLTASPLPASTGGRHDWPCSRCDGHAGRYDCHFCHGAGHIRMSLPAAGGVGVGAAAFGIETLTGKTPKEQRVAILERFRKGQTRVLISRAAMLGYGMNFQCCASMVFSGWTFSYESFYQAVRRAYRHGQTKAVRVHVPIVPALEGQMWDAIVRKQRQHEESVAEMEANYAKALLVIRGQEGEQGRKGAA